MIDYYVNQKLPNKKKNKQHRTKYYRFIPRNPLMNQENEYIRDKSGKKIKDSNLSIEEVLYQNNISIEILFIFKLKDFHIYSFIK